MAARLCRGAATPPCQTFRQSPFRCWRPSVERQAQLIARWMGVGFIHGVMNTDNMSISGETIDYGRVRSWRVSIRPRCSARSTVRGRYAYGQQPTMAQWNLARLAEALLPVLDARDIDVVEQVEQVVARFCRAL